MENDCSSLYMHIRKNWKKEENAVTRIGTCVIAATTQCTNHYTITATLFDFQLLIYSLMNDIT